MTLRIKGLLRTLGINGIQHNDTKHKRPIKDASHKRHSAYNDLKALRIKCSYAESRYTECRYAECQDLFFVMLTAIMLGVVILNVSMLSVTIYLL